MEEQSSTLNAGVNKSGLVNSFMLFYVLGCPTTPRGRKFELLQAIPGIEHLALDTFEFLIRLPVGQFGELFLTALLEQARLFIEAGKSSQISKLYAADAGLAWLRFQLRFLSHPSRRLITPKNHKVASQHLAEVGRLLGAWILKVKGEKKG